MAPRARTTIGLLYAATLMAATPAFAQQAATHSDVVTQADGQKAAVDANGRLREVTPEEARQLVAGLTSSLSHADAGLTQVRLANGARMVDLDGRFESAMLAKLGADGAADTECVTNVDEAEAFLLGTPPDATLPTHAPTALVLEER